MKTLLGIVVIVSLLIAVQTNSELQEKLRAVSSGASAQILSHNAKNDVRLVNGEFDAGITAHLTVKNNGKAGLIQIAAIVSCSDGEWTRSQNVSFEEDETKDFEFFFSEPTINATNIQVRYHVTP